MNTQQMAKELATEKKTILETEIKREDRKLQELTENQKARKLKLASLDEYIGQIEAESKKLQETL